MRKRPARVMLGSKVMYLPKKIVCTVTGLNGKYIIAEDEEGRKYTSQKQYFELLEQ